MHVGTSRGQCYVEPDQRNDAKSDMACLCVLLLRREFTSPVPLTHWIFCFLALQSFSKQTLNSATCCGFVSVRECHG